MAPIKTSLPSAITSISTSIASFKNLSSRTGESFETDTASSIYLFKSSSVVTISIALPPKTYDGLTTKGYPISFATFKASLTFVAIELLGCLNPSFSTKSLNFSLSSARSIASGDVPIMLTLFCLSLLASFKGVCPPY